MRSQNIYGLLVTKSTKIDNTVGLIVTAFYNLGVLLIATGTFKGGGDFAVGVGIGSYMMILGFLIDFYSEGGKDE